MPDFPAPAVANVFLDKFGGAGRLTQMQLQKLTYFAHGWNLAINGEPLVDEEFQAWDYGPVSQGLYEHTRYFGSDAIKRPITSADADRWKFFVQKRPKTKPYRARLDPEEEDVLRRVFDRYGGLDAFQMSKLTHQPGTPWHACYVAGKNRPIPNDMIRKHYRKLAKVAAG